jgi:hypothetical protein
MCGGEGSLRIEPAENGFTIEAYTPGGMDRPGKHKRHVATTAEQAVKIAHTHLKSMGKKIKKSPKQVEVKSSASKSPELKRA